MSDSHEGLPFRYTFGEGIEPITAAWTQSTIVTRAEYNRIARKPKELTAEEAEISVGLGGVALGKEESALLIERHDPVHGKSLEKLREIVRTHSLAAGIPPEEVDRLVNVLLLGVIVGRKEAQIIEAYTKQGVNDIEAGDSTDS